MTVPTPFGTLRETLQVNPKGAGTPRPRSFSERELHRENAPRATQWWCQAGAPVRLVVEHKKEGKIAFSLRDQKLAIIHADANVNYDGNGAADAYFHAMRRNDEYTASTVHRYNILQAICICRNRITYWSNPGVLAGTAPPSEQLHKALSVVKLCRNAVSPMTSSSLVSFNNADARYTTE